VTSRVLCVCVGHFLQSGKKEKPQFVHRVSSAAVTRMRTAQSGDVAAGRSLFGEASRFLEKLSPESVNQFRLQTEVHAPWPGRPSSARTVPEDLPRHGGDRPPRSAAHTLPLLLPLLRLLTGFRWVYYRDNIEICITLYGCLCSPFLFSFSFVLFTLIE